MVIYFIVASSLPS